jgi:REP element-mobilizing transposase RayT
MIYEYMKMQFWELGCYVSIINGVPDHVHCLFLLNPKRPVSEIIKQVKGSTSHFTNDQNLCDEKFVWQVGYAAYSVSESAIENVFEYIKNQKHHHGYKTFEQEYDELMITNGITPEA